jgi:hypothetical protein
VVVDATARLYDVDEDSLVFQPLRETKRYDQGTITFHARKGKLINLDKLQESIWATRLSGGTRSGLVSLEVTVIGNVMETENGLVLKVAHSSGEFALGAHPDKKFQALYQKLKAGGSGRMVRLSGVIDNYRGRWPDLLRKPPPTKRRILVTEFQFVE